MTEEDRMEGLRLLADSVRHAKRITRKMNPVSLRLARQKFSITPPETKP